MNKNKGITLIALVITIIILLILAGISIATLSGENGLFARAKQARKNTLDAQDVENGILLGYEDTINSIVEGSRETVSISKEEYEQIKSDLESLKTFQEENAQLKSDVEALKTQSSNSGKTVLWETEETGTRTVELQQDIKEYDYLIVYYHLTNMNYGNVMLSTTESETSLEHYYTSSSAYIFGEFSIDIDSNSVNMVVTGTKWTGTDNAFLKKIVGIKL